MLSGGYFAYFNTKKLSKIWWCLRNHGIRFMQTIPRTHSTHNTLGIVHKGNLQHTTETLGKFHTENITFSFANSMYKVACVCDLVLSMWQLWCLAQIERIKVCHHRHEEPKGKCLVLCSWRRERGYVLETPKLLAPPWGRRNFAPDGRRKWVYQ